MFQKNKHRKILYLLDILLFLLVILAELPRIYLFSESDRFREVLNIVQIPIYAGILYIIAKQKYTIKQLLLFTGIGIVLLFGYIQSGQAAFFRGLLLILAVKNVPFKRMIHTCRMAVTSVLVLAILLWVTDLSDAGMMRRGYVAFGYVHPNIVAQVVMIIALLWVAEKAEQLRKRDYFIIEGTALLIYLISGSRTGMAVLAIAPVILMATKKLMAKERYLKTPVFCLEISQLVMLTFTYLTAKYLPQSSFLKTLDLLFTNRLFLNYYQLEHHPIVAFGQNIDLADYTGTVYNNIQNVWGAAVTCDNTYMMSLLVMGLIPTVFFLIGYILVIKKGVRERNYAVIGVALILALYGFFEVQMLEIYNNFIYFYITAAYSLTDRKLSMGRSVIEE